MSRIRLTDFLGAHRFWAFDATSPKYFPVFTPLFGFSGISAPHIQAEVEQFKDGTFGYQRSVIKGGSVGSITFSRGASMYDSDFYDWISLGIYGTQPDSFKGKANLANAGTSLTQASTPTISSSVLVGVRRNIVVVHFSSMSEGIEGALSLGPFEFASRIPARAWILHSCIPVNYIAGSDFDANNGSISIMELEVQPEWIEQLDVGI